MRRQIAAELHIVHCDYCGDPATLEDSSVVYGGRSFGKIWHCRHCRAWVGVHKNSARFAPLGRLANAELRVWKQRAHAVLDPLWKRGPSRIGTREEVYALASKFMGYSIHIGQLNVEECQRLIVMLERHVKQHKGKII